MSRLLLDCATGEAAVYETRLSAFRQDGQLIFRFEAQNSSCYCPYSHYNENHYEGDVCEIFLCSKADRHHYYEINLAPNNCLLFGKLSYQGETENGEPIKTLEKIDRSSCFVTSRVLRTPGGYVAQIALEEAALNIPPEDICFNAFRIETDGGASEKHLFALNPTYMPRFHVPKAFVPLLSIL